MHKVPYMLVAGERERASGTVSLRTARRRPGAVALDRVVRRPRARDRRARPDLTVGRS